MCAIIVNGKTYQAAATSLRVAYTTGWILTPLSRYIPIIIINQFPSAALGASDLVMAANPREDKSTTIIMSPSLTQIAARKNVKPGRDPGVSYSGMLCRLHAAWCKRVLIENVRFEWLQAGRQR